MDIAATKIALVKMILDIHDPQLLERTKVFLAGKLEETTYPLSPAEQSEIQEGLAQLEAGQRVDWNEFINQVS